MRRTVAWHSPSNLARMPAAGRVVEVDLDRLPGWVERFTVRHGALTEEVVFGDGHQVVALAAIDGARADLAVPFGPLSALKISRSLSDDQ